MPNAVPTEMQFYEVRKKAIRLKVFGTIRYWIKEHSSDFEDAELVGYLKESLLDISVRKMNLFLFY